MLILHNKKVCVCEDLKPQIQNVYKCLVGYKPTISRDDMIAALEQRMKHCWETLQEYVSKQETCASIQGDYSVVYYKNGGSFSGNSYYAMEKAIEILKKMPSIIVEDHLKVFDATMLNQMLKADVDFHGKWTAVASMLLDVITTNSAFLK
jgi:hypothetical protein